jgi:GxxExxY protein
MKALDGPAEAQVINYLRATGLKVGLLINFGPEVEIKRLIFWSVFISEISG